MGNAPSLPSDPRFASATRAFAKKEFQDLRSLFVSLAVQSQSNGHFISSDVFQAFFGIRGALGDRMFDLVTQERRDGRLTFEDLVIAKGTYEKGGHEEIEDFVYRLCDVDGDGVVARSDLEGVLTSMLDAIFKSEYTESDLDYCDKSPIYMFINGATFSRVAEGGIECISFENFKNWCSLLPSVWKFLCSLLAPPDPGRPDIQAPHLQYPDTLNRKALILKKEHAWHIAGALPQSEMGEWKLVYHSAVHGLSFNTFLRNISGGDRPTVLVIQDKEGYIYGGYASQPWEKHSSFYGDMKTFLFQLHPQASIFRPTGSNTNLQWFAVNFSSDSIPNGIGFGGRVAHFGLFLSANFEDGHTYRCTTFDSPCLSKTNRILPEVIECWGISLKEASEGKVELVKGTVLGRFKEDHNMLKMVGLANNSSE